MKNVFDSPTIYSKTIVETNNLVRYDTNTYRGKSFLCLFLTRFCGVGCPFCFFKSPPNQGASDIRDSFTQEGVDKFIKFANEANVGYLQISGGGESFLKRKALLRCITEVNADRIMLVTSGVWASSEDVGEAYVRDIASALEKREKPARVSIRLSISEGHSIKLANKPLVNLLKIFEENYRSHPYLTLQLKTFEGDKTLWKFLESLDSHKLESIGDNASDDPFVTKVIPWKKKLIFPSGYSVILGISRVFDPGLRPNLNNPQSISNTISVYNQDIDQSENDFPALVLNPDGTKGLDWLVEYNGNVCTWQNRVQDNLLNVYEDDFNTVLQKTFSDPLTLSYIEKGSKRRDEIISEVSPRAVTLMKAVSVRDYAGNCLFEDEKVRLYYTIRTLQDYIEAGRVNLLELNKLPKDLLDVIRSTKEDIITLFKEAHHSIVDQEIKRGPTLIEFRDFLELLKLGHFDVSEAQIARAITYYNERMETDKKISDYQRFSVKTRSLFGIGGVLRET
ncbi:MAG: radical SAM protein [Alphaproteobacteria bacterium]|nr:radical SAM protein [Alphaproteobacteria bacterium]